MTHPVTFRIRQSAKLCPTTKLLCFFLSQAERFIIRHTPCRCRRTAAVWFPTEILLYIPQIFDWFFFSWSFLPHHAVQQALRDFFHKTGDFVILCLSPGHTHPCAGQSQMFSGSCNSHITQTSLFFHFGRVIRSNRHITWEQPVFHTCQINIRELQSLCAVQCHQHHIITVLFQIINICN